MNRRTFSKLLTAVLGSPALPGAALAAPGVSAQQMRNAAIIARAHNRLTPDMLMRHLKLSPDLAAQVQSQLLRQGVITAPVGGVSMAVNPTNTSVIPNEALRPTNLLQKARALRDHARRLMADIDAQADAETDPAPAKPL